MKKLNKKSIIKISLITIAIITPLIVGLVFTFVDFNSHQRETYSINIPESYDYENFGKALRKHDVDKFNECDVYYRESDYGEINSMIIVSSMELEDVIKESKDSNDKKERKLVESLENIDDREDYEDFLYELSDMMTEETINEMFGDDVKLSKIKNSIVRIGKDKYKALQWEGKEEENNLDISAYYIVSDNYYYNIAIMAKPSRSHEVERILKSFTIKDSISYEGVKSVNGIIIVIGIAEILIISSIVVIVKRRKKSSESEQ